MDLGRELVRGLVTDGRVFAVGVVVAFAVIEAFCASVAGVLEAALLEPCEFARSAEGLGPGVCIGVGAGGQALPEARPGQSLAKWGAAGLAATIALEEGVRGGAGLQGLVEGGADAIAAPVWSARRQPTRRREPRALTTARSSPPALVGMKVLSPAQARSGAAGRG